MKVRNLLVEGDIKEIAKQIRNFIKKRYKLTSRDVSVKMGHPAVWITIKSLKALPYFDKLKNLAKEMEDVHYDDLTNEILSGGNTYVEVQIDSGLLDAIGEKIKNEILKQKPVDFNNGEAKSYSYEINSSIRISYLVPQTEEAKRDELYREPFKLIIDGRVKNCGETFSNGCLKELISLTSKRKSAWEKFLKIII